MLRATAPAPCPHAVLRLSLPGLDIGADAWQAGQGTAGYVELWIEPHDADDIQTIVRIEGSPALPRVPRRRPRLPWILAEILATHSTLLRASCDQMGQVL